MTIEETLNWGLDRAELNSLTRDDGDMVTFTADIHDLVNMDTNYEMSWGFSKDAAKDEVFLAYILLTQANVSLRDLRGEE